MTGDATDPQGGGPRVIVHVCNDIGAWGAGFVLALSRRWRRPEEHYQEWFSGKEQIPFALGQVQFVPVEDALWVANLIGQHGIRRRGAAPPVRYEAIREGLQKIAEFAVEKGASVHMPRIGSGLAGGKWEEVSRIIEEVFSGRSVAVTVYDLPR